MFARDISRISMSIYMHVRLRAGYATAKIDGSCIERLCPALDAERLKAALLGLESDWLAGSHLEHFRFVDHDGAVDDHVGDVDELM